MSNQGDLLIIDESDPSPYFFRMGDLVVVHPRAVACVIEVKTRLGKREFLEAVNNLSTFKGVGADNNFGDSVKNFPVTLMFGFEGTKMTLKTLDKWYKEITIIDDISNYPQVVFCLDHGALILRPKAENHPHGHYFIQGENNEERKLKTLSLFLQTVRKLLRARQV